MTIDEQKVRRAAEKVLAEYTTHAERCPVCNGVGKIAPAPQYNTTSFAMPSLCHGCAGVGWVTVRDCGCKAYSCVEDLIEALRK